MQRKPPVMRPNARRLRELRGDRSQQDVGAVSGVDWRTIALFESGDASDRFQFNTLNQLAYAYEVPFDELVEEVPQTRPDLRAARRLQVEQVLHLLADSGRLSTSEVARALSVSVEQAFGLLSSLAGSQGAGVVVRDGRADGGENGRPPVCWIITPAGRAALGYDPLPTAAPRVPAQAPA